MYNPYVTHRPNQTLSVLAETFHFYEIFTKYEVVVCLLISTAFICIIFGNDKYLTKYS